MPLRTLVSKQELALLEAALRWLESASPRAFSLLFEPGQRGPSIPLPPDAVLRTLLAFDLVERTDDGIRGLLRIRRHAGRYYVMEIGLGNDVEYMQDVWPETDALLAALDKPCRLLDLGTGCGIVAIEAALRGYEVVATDVYQPTLVLARFNARLNLVEERIQFREGHLWEPVRGEKFDLVLTNPHYGHTDDQLRLEVLRGAPDHLNGRMLLATALEWDAHGLGIECVLHPLVDAGFAVTVAPLESSYKRDWFTVATGDPLVPSRHRFTVDVVRSATPELRISWPKDPPTSEFVPLARLAKPGVFATIATGPDAAALDELLSQFDAPDVTFTQPLAMGIHDACRWGLSACVGPRSAAGAIARPDGSIRPCSHGPAIARADEPLTVLNQRYEELAAQARLRRGCTECPAESVCSQCLYPVALDEKAYCSLIQKHFPVLGAFLRLLETVEELEQMKLPQGPFRVRRWPRHGLPLTGVAAEWNRLRVWIVERAGRSFLTFRRGGALRFLELSADAADLGATLADGGEVSPRAATLIGELLAG